MARGLGSRPPGWAPPPQAAEPFSFPSSEYLISSYKAERLQQGSLGEPRQWEPLIRVRGRDTRSQAPAPKQADEGFEHSAQHSCERVSYSQRRMWHFLSLLSPTPSFIPVRCGLTTSESSRKTGWGMHHLCPENCTKWMDKNLMRSFSAIQAPLLIIQMFNFLLQYAVRINALWRRYRNFSFQKRRKASDLKRKSHRVVWHYYVSFYPPDSLKLMTGTGSALKFQQREIFCSLPLINKVHSGNADRLWSKQHPQVLLWYTACLLKHSSSNSLAVFNWYI